jgi:hypothetical protein
MASIWRDEMHLPQTPRGGTGKETGLDLREGRWGARPRSVTHGAVVVDVQRPLRFRGHVKRQLFRNAAQRRGRSAGRRWSPARPRPGPLQARRCSRSETLAGLIPEVAGNRRAQRCQAGMGLGPLPVFGREAKACSFRAWGMGSTRAGDAVRESPGAFQGQLGGHGRRRTAARQPSLSRNRRTRSADKGRSLRRPPAAATPRAAAAAP